MCWTTFTPTTFTCSCSEVAPPLLQKSSWDALFHSFETKNGAWALLYPPKGQQSMGPTTQPPHLWYLLIIGQLGSYHKLSLQNFHDKELNRTAEECRVQQKNSKDPMSTLNRLEEVIFLIYFFIFLTKSSSIASISIAPKWHSSPSMESGLYNSQKCKAHSLDKWQLQNTKTLNRSICHFIPADE